MSYAIDLSSSASANCYIVSEVGVYKFKAVQGNGTIPVFNVSSVEVMWESFGTSKAPDVGDLVAGVCYKDGYVVFHTTDTFKKGNAVIVLKDASGNILWSWHIWFTDQPSGQVYYNNAGIMMDRNLGATSTIPGDVGSLGLFYQWGRKDPLPGPSSISSNIFAKSTLNKIAYVDPLSSYWTLSGDAKIVFDPCPIGWRVPDGGVDGVWTKALGTSSSYSEAYDSVNKGMNFSGKLGDDTNIWYPASGYIDFNTGYLISVGVEGRYATASTFLPCFVSCLNFYDSGMADPGGYATYDECGFSVRCIKE
jgi:hypothetical protein